MITFYAKPSPEKTGPVWQTTRFGLSCWGMALASGSAIWGAFAGQAAAVGAGSLSAAVIVGVYVWALSKEP
jgi:hypothetical protein